MGFGKSGGYRVLSRLADELIRLGTTVSFMSSDLSHNPYFPTKASVIWINKLGKISGGPNNENGNFLTYFNALRKGYRQIMKEGSFDIVLLNHSLTAFSLPAALKSKAVYYCQAYEPDYYYKSGGLKNQILAKLSERSYRRGLFTIVNSEIFKNYKKLNSTRVLYPGIDFNIFYPAHSRTQIKEKIILGTIGRTEVFKGSKYIYEAFSTLRKSHAGIELHIAFGSEESIKNIEGVKIITPRNDSELAEYYRSLDFYICAGNIHFGAFHYPVVEAMACGVPVITTPYFAVSDSNSYLISPNNVVDIVDKFESAISNPVIQEEKISCALQAVSKLTWERAGKGMLSFMNEKLGIENMFLLN